jgi:RNA polymerase sigma-70 factor (ECF subfamily)
MARRRAVDRVRSEQSQRDRADELSRQPHDEAASPSDAVISSMDVTRVRSAVASLPADQREVIELCFFEGLSHGDVADRLGVPLGTVKGRARGGLRKLRGRVGGTP